MIEVTFRPLTDEEARQYLGSPPYGLDRSPFRSTHGQTQTLLDRELFNLRAKNIVIQLALVEGQIRLDGHPKASAIPSHPGVLLSFESRHGPLRYGTGRFHHWSDNLRAIALGLEALRKVDRYGITRRGEQYAGWRQLPAGDGPSAERGRSFVEAHGSVAGALKATHPDHGGDARDFADVQAYRELSA